MKFSELSDKSISALVNVFDNINDDNCIIEQLGGMTNHTYLVNCVYGKYVLREFGEGTEDLVDRTNEYIIAKHDPDMSILYYNIDEGVSIMKYHSNTRELRLEDINNRVTGITKRLLKLHKSDLDIKYPYIKFNVLDKINSYYSKVKSYNMTNTNIIHVRSQISKMYDLYDLMIKVANIISNNPKISRSMCHNDLVPSNLLIDEDDSIKLIDYEYVGINDPAWDYASLFLETYDSPIYYATMASNKMVKVLDDLYCDKCFVLRVTICMMLQDYLWSLWTVIKLYNGSDKFSYTEYLDKRLSRLIRFVELSSDTINYFISTYKL